MLEWFLRTNVSLVSVFCTHALGAASSNYITCAIEFLAIRKLERGGSFLIVLVIQFVVCSLIHFDIAMHEWRQSDESSDERGSSSSFACHGRSSSLLVLAVRCTHHTSPRPPLPLRSLAAHPSRQVLGSLRAGDRVSATPHTLSFALRSLEY